MRWRSVAGLCLLAIAPCAPALGQDKVAPVATVAGRSLDYWVSQIASKDPSKSENAIRVVMLFGPEKGYQAVPAILDRLRAHSSTKPVDASVRVNGAIALGYILGGYPEADPKVVKDAVAILKRFLADNQSIIRFRGAQALGRIGNEARSAIPEMISVVKDTATWETRQAAAIALGQIAQDKNGPTFNVLNALYGALGDGSVQVRLSAIQSLTALGGPLNPEMRLGLVKALEPVAYKDPEPSVKIWAHMAIMSVTRSATNDRIGAIAQMLQNPDMVARANSAQALGVIGRDAKAAIPSLTVALKDSESSVVGWSVWALGRMQQSAAGVVPALERIQADTHQPEYIRKLAQEAIEEIGGKKKVAQPR